MSLFSPKQELGLVFHIGSASVGVGLVKFEEGKPPHVLYTSREYLPHRENITSDVLLDDMAYALKAINLRLPKEGVASLAQTPFKNLKVRHISYVFSSPWVATQTKIVSIQDDQGFVLTTDQVKRVIAAQEKMFEAELSSAGGLAGQLSVIEKRVIQIKLNGYEVQEPYGKKARQADVSLFISLIPKAILDRVFAISQATYHPKDTTVSSFPLVSFSAIRDVFHSENDFIFLDIGGEVTDVSIIKSGLILETASFPLGRNFVMRKITSALAMSPNEALSLAKLYFEGHADSGAVEKIEPLLKGAEEEWVKVVHGVLGDLSGRMALPTNIYATINADWASFFVDALQNKRVSEFGVGNTAFNVILVNHDTLKNGVTCEKGAEKDAFIALMTVFAGRLYEAKLKK